jgi:hypothetical protein
VRKFVSVNSAYPKSESRPTKTIPDPKPNPSRKRNRWLRLGLLGIGLTGLAMVSATAGAILAISLSSTPLRQSNPTLGESSVFSLQNAIAYSPKLQLSTLLGFIFAHNQPSLGLFQKNGFERWGHLPKIAELDDVKRDLVILGRRV